MNLLGKKIAKWTILRQPDKPPYSARGSLLWVCRCECGNESIIPSRHLNRYERGGINAGCRQCGIRTSDGSSPDVAGKEFGTWRVIRRLGTRGEGDNRKSLWLCQCLVCSHTEELIRGSLVVSAGKEHSQVGPTDTLGLGSPQKCINCMTIEAENLVGTACGQYTICDTVPPKRLDNGVASPAYVICYCSCGRETRMTVYRWKHSQSEMCFECRDTKIAANRREKAFKDASTDTVTISRFLRRRRHDAEKRGLQYAISDEYAISLFTGTCALSGVDIYLNNTFSHPSDWKGALGPLHQLNTASLDRIDSTKGYIPGNVQWVHHLVNIAKQVMTDQQFISMCKTVTVFQKDTVNDNTWIDVRGMDRNIRAKRQIASLEIEASTEK